MLGSYIGRPMGPPRYDALPGAGHLNPPDSPIKMAGHFIYNLRRPSRFRGRFTITIVAFLFLFFMFSSTTRRADIQQYVSARLNSHFYEAALSRKSRWQDDEELNYIQNMKSMKPNFHLLIIGPKASMNLCQTLLSAAVLNYPTPTLIGHGLTDKEVTMEYQVVEGVLGYLSGKGAHDDDIVLIVDERTWFQLPPELVISRFHEVLSVSNARLLEKYGRIEDTASRSKHPSLESQKYSQKIMFGASKTCDGASTNDILCSLIPSSSLPNDIYGEDTDKGFDVSHNRPRYLDPHNVLGKVTDLRRLYEQAAERLKLSHRKGRTGPNTFSAIFAKQEVKREVERKSSLSSGAAWREWISQKFGGDEDSIDQLNSTLLTAEAKEADIEFGIGLDYESSIFQLMNNSASDVHFISFSQATMIKSPSRIASKSFQSPIQIPVDLNSTAPPFEQLQVPATISTLDALELDRLPSWQQWKDVHLATNVIVPGSQVPVSLSVADEEDFSSDSWPKMWFQPYARALMRRYMRSSQGKAVAEAAEDGGQIWWDLRGGKGGVWTEKGEWFEWSEVCVDYDNAIFGDHKGSLGEEEEDDGE